MQTFPAGPMVVAGDALHAELRALAALGLSAADALHAATGAGGVDRGAAGDRKYRRRGAGRRGLTDALVAAQGARLAGLGLREVYGRFGGVGRDPIWPRIP
jgi:hypothetical protein